MNTLLLIQIIFVIIGSVIYASLFEWVLHKHVMHGKPLGFKYAYKAHHQKHHVIFGAHKTYTLPNHPPEKREAHKKTIPMAWWNWIVLLAIASFPVALICTLVISIWWPILVTSIVFLLYYITYEYFHWCMHDPKDRWFENSWWFVAINNHHNLHHAKTGKNLNVVLPFADWLFRTLIR